MRHNECPFCGTGYVSGNDWPFVQCDGCGSYPNGWVVTDTIHLAAERLDMLHLVAAYVGLARHRFHNPRPGKHPHYDILPESAAGAIIRKLEMLGVSIVPARELVRLLNERKEA